MTRKSKRAGGCLPLTYSERNRYRVITSNGSGSSAVAAAAASASSSRSLSLLPLGYCALTLSKIDDPPLDAVVVTPSGHVYSKAALLEYVLVQTKQLQQQRQEYEANLQRQEQVQQQQLVTKQEKDIDNFERLQQQRGRTTTLTNTNTNNPKRSHTALVDNHHDNDNGYDDEPTKQKKIKQELQRSSFWLAVAQPSLQDHHDATANDDNNPTITTSTPPPTRPVSPCSGQVLRRKQWREVVLERQQKDDDDVSGNSNGVVLCGFSGKTITTQPCVAIFPPKSTSGYVCLQQAYNEYIRPTMTCPRTNVPLNESKHVVILQQHGRSTHHDDDVDDNNK